MLWLASSPPAIHLVRESLRPRKCTQSWRVAVELVAALATLAALAALTTLTLLAVLAALVALAAQLADASRGL